MMTTELLLDIVSIVVLPSHSLLYLLNYLAYASDMPESYTVDRDTAYASDMLT